MEQKIALLMKFTINMNNKIGLKPLIGKNASVLVLGSLPGDESLRKQEYYGNPNNMFWDIMSCILKEEAPTKYTDKIKYLERHGIALWDILKSAERQGSLDSNICKEEFNDIASLILDNPTIDTIVTNGGKAEKLFRKYLRVNPFLKSKKILHFKSTSAMSRCAGWNLNKLALQWSEIAE